MNVLAAFRTDLYRIIRSTLPEITGPIATVAQIQRLNWVNQVKSKGLVPPWVALNIPVITPDSDFSSPSAPTWKVTPSIYYIASISAGDGDIGAFLESRMTALQDALLFQLPYTVLPSEMPVMDASEDTPVNNSFLANDAPFLAASLTFSALIGYAHTP